MILVDWRRAMGGAANKGGPAAKYKAFRLSDRHREMLAAVRDSTPGVTTDTGAVRHLIETAYLALRRKERARCRPNR